MSVESNAASGNRYAGVSWPIVAGCLTYLGFLANGKMLLGDPDTYWHVAAGRWMLEHSAKWPAPPSRRSSRSTLVITTYFKAISAMVSAR